MTLSTSPESIALSKDLERRGWTFVGPTTACAFMQAMGWRTFASPAAPSIQTPADLHDSRPQPDRGRVDLGAGSP